MSTSRKRVLLIVLGIAAGLSAAELALRISGSLYREARRSKVFEASSGQRDLNILCLGDSCTFGLGAPKGSSCPDHLQRLFDAVYPGRVRVINQGVPGANSSMILRNLEKNIERYRPQVVLLLVGLNDASNLRQGNQYLFMHGPRAFLLKADAVLSCSRVYKFLKHFTHLGGHGRTWDKEGRFLLRGTLSEADAGIFRQALAYNLQEILRVCRERKILLVLQTYDQEDWPSAVAVEFARSRNIPCIDHRGLFKGEADKSRFFAKDGHPNAEGYLRAARNIQKTLFPILFPRGTRFSGAIRAGTRAGAPGG
ncbi:MAG: GDSL-type esterase/lipase family protein [Elusimicrobiota bacterium]|jgi:lysophospholipase L1-like esterase